MPPFFRGSKLNWQAGRANRQCIWIILPVLLGCWSSGAPAEGEKRTRIQFGLTRAISIPPEKFILASSMRPADCAGRSTT
jgi:hypothetical protein